MDPMTIMMLISEAAKMAGMGQGKAPEGAGLPGADSGAGNIFGDNTQTASMENARPGVPQYSAGPAGATPLPQGTPIGGSAPIAPPIPPPQVTSQTQAPGSPIALPQQTFSQGVDAPNVVPPVSGSTGGEIPISDSPNLLGSPSPGVAWNNTPAVGGPTPLSDTPEWQGPPMPYEPQGPPMPYEPQGPPLPPGMGPMGATGDPRLQDILGVAGPMAGMVGAAAGARGRGGPGSGGFPARPFQMAPSLASLPPRRRY